MTLCDCEDDDPKPSRLGVYKAPGDPGRFILRDTCQDEQCGFMKEYKDGRRYDRRDIERKHRKGDI
jgi:hypothetical protein